MSDLGNNILQPYGEGDGDTKERLEFNQNTVPFDFDGKRLLWMKYVDKDIREIWIFTFETNEAKMVK